MLCGCPICSLKTQARLLNSILVRIVFSFKVQLTLRDQDRIHGCYFKSAPGIRKARLVKNFHRVSKPRSWTAFRSWHCHFLAVTLEALLNLSFHFVFCKLSITSIPTGISTHAKVWTVPGTKVLHECSETLSFGYLKRYWIQSCKKKKKEKRIPASRMDETQASNFALLKPH